MYELDHMLNGRGSRQHLQQMIREAQQAKVGRNIEAAQRNAKTVLPLYAILIAAIHIIRRKATVNPIE
jgi:hypothetical protein